jgi:predicted nucleic acid-binding Zn ribbon protein
MWDIPERFKAPRQQARYRPRFPVRKWCITCGEGFTTTRVDTKTCSPKCRKALSRGVNKSMEETTGKKPQE